MDFLELVHIFVLFSLFIVFCGKSLCCWDRLLWWHFWSVFNIKFLEFFCADWEVCWNWHSSTVDYIIHLSGESFSLVFSASDIMFCLFFTEIDAWIFVHVFFFCLWIRIELLSCSILMMLWCDLFLQYLKHFKILHYHFFELFPILFGVAIVWVYATILTVAGTYDHASALGQIHCRTDRSGLVSTAPW